MGLLRRLFPWYNWNDQWSHHVFSIDDGSIQQPVVFTLEPGFRLQLLTVTYILDTGTGIDKRFPDIEIWRGSNRFFHTTSAGIVGQNSLGEVAFMIGLSRSALNSATHHVVSNLSSAAFMLPGDRLVIGAEGMLTFDRVEDIVVSAKRWID